MRLGDQVKAGDEIGRCYGSRDDRVQAAAKELLESLAFSDEPVELAPLIVE